MHPKKNIKHFISQYISLINNMIGPKTEKNPFFSDKYLTGAKVGRKLAPFKVR